MTTNCQRARDAEVCLATFTALTGDEGLHAVIDLLADLGHFTTAMDWISSGC